MGGDRHVRKIDEIATQIMYGTMQATVAHAAVMESGFPLTFAPRIMVGEVCP